LLVTAKLLSKDIFNVFIDCHQISGLPLGRPADLDSVSINIHRCPGEFRGYLQHPLFKTLPVDRIIKLNYQRHQRAAIIRPSTMVIYDLEWRVSVEGVILRRLRHQRSLCRGGIGSDRDTDLGIGRQRLISPECQPAALVGIFRQLANDLIFSDLILTGQLHADQVVISGDHDRLKDTCGIYPLIKRDKKDRLQRLGIVGWVIADYGRRGSTEFEFHAFSQDSADRRLGSRWYNDLVFGRHRHPVDQIGIILKIKGLCSQPAPGSWQSGEDLHRHFPGSEIFNSGQRNHWLVKCNIDKRSDRNFAFRRESQNFKGAGFDCNWSGTALRGECFIDGRSRSWGRNDLIRQVEIDLIFGISDQGRQTRQKGSKLFTSERSPLR